MTETAKLTALAEAAKSALGDAVLDVKFTVGELTLMVARGKLPAVLTYLRDDPNWLFKTLIDISGVDFPQRAERFEVVYHLLSIHKNLRVRVKTSTDAATPRGERR